MLLIPNSIRPCESPKRFKRVSAKSLFSWHGRQLWRDNSMKDERRIRQIDSWFCHRLLHRQSSVCILYYQITRVLHTLWLDELHFLSEYRHGWRHFHFVLQFRDVNDTTKTQKKSWLFHKTNRNYLSCLCTVIETCMTPFQQEKYKKKH